MNGRVDPRKTTVDLTKFGEDKNGSGESSFTFTARDKNGSPVESNIIFGSKIINNESGVETEVFIEEIGGGNYVVKFPVLPLGVYLVVLGISSVSKTIIQEMVKGSPFTVRVGPDPAKPKKLIVDSHHCYLFGPGSVRSVVKRKSSFSIQACDHIGEKLKTGGDVFRVKIIPPAGTNKLSNLPCNLVDQLDGTYTVTYTANVVGNHIVHVTESEYDTPIKNSPFTISISESISPGEEVDVSSANIKFGAQAIPLGGSTFAFPVTVKSASGGKMRLSVTFRSKVLGPTGLDVQQKLQETEDGQFLLKFVPKAHGPHQFELDVCTNGSDKFSSVYGCPSELDLQLSINDEGGICAAKVLKVTPIQKQPQEKKHPASAPTSPVLEAIKQEIPKAAFLLNKPSVGLRSGSSSSVQPRPKPSSTPSSPASPLSPASPSAASLSPSSPSGGLNSGSNSNIQPRIPPKNPATINQRRFSSPPSPSPFNLSTAPPPKNPAPGSPSLSDNPPSWLVAKKQ